jgi:uncharacterized protein YlbG (UPF0298 family)
MESFKDYIQLKDYKELIYFTNKMKYNLIDNDKNTDLEKTLNYLWKTTHRKNNFKSSN